CAQLSRRRRSQGCSATRSETSAWDLGATRRLDDLRMLAQFVENDAESLPDSDTVSPVPLVGPPVQHHLEPADLLAVGLQSAPADVALLSNRRRVTWRDLDDESRLLAAGYRQFGLSPGDRVASLMPNCIDLVVHYLACLRSGLVVTPLNYRYTHREID